MWVRGRLLCVVLCPAAEHQRRRQTARARQTLSRLVVGRAQRGHRLRPRQSPAPECCRGGGGWPMARWRILRQLRHTGEKLPGITVFMLHTFPWIHCKFKHQHAEMCEKSVIHIGSESWKLQVMACIGLLKLFQPATGTRALTCQKGSSANHPV